MTSPPVPLPSRVEQLRRISELIGKAQERFMARMADLDSQRAAVMVREFEHLASHRPVPPDLLAEAQGLDAEQLTVLDQMTEFLAKQDKRIRTLLEPRP